MSNESQPVQQHQEPDFRDAYSGTVGQGAGSAQPETPTPRAPIEGREMLGRIVRATWIEWAKEQPAPKPSWLVPWDGLSEPDKEVDRRIGERLAILGPQQRVSELADELATLRAENARQSGAIQELGEKLAAERDRAIAIQSILNGTDCPSTDDMAGNVKWLADELERSHGVVMSTRQLSIDAMNEIRAAVGADPRDPMRAIDYVQRVVKERDDLRAALEEIRRLTRPEIRTVERISTALNQIDAVTVNALSTTPPAASAELSDAEKDAERLNHLQRTIDAMPAGVSGFVTMINATTHRNVRLAIDEAVAAASARASK